MRLVALLTALLFISAPAWAGTTQAGQTAAIAQSVTGPTLTKGTQGSTGFSIQELKDAGRVNISWTANAVASTATAEGLTSLDRSVDMAASSKSVFYTITSGKRLRLTQLSVGIQQAGTAPKPSRVRLRVRGAVGGSCGAASPLQEYAVVSSSGPVGTSAMFSRNYPDGLEIAGQGDGTKQICFTVETPDWVTSSNASLIDIDINGFEY